MHSLKSIASQPTSHCPPFWQGTKAIIVTGSSTERAKPFADALKAAGIEVSLFSIGESQSTCCMRQTKDHSQRQATA